MDELKKMRIRSTIITIILIFLVIFSITSLNFSKPVGIFLIILLLTFMLPLICIKFATKFESDFFLYKYTVPLLQGLLVSLMILVVSNKESIVITDYQIYSMAIVVCLFYLIMHQYMLKKYPGFIIK